MKTRTRLPVFALSLLACSLSVFVQAPAGARQKSVVAAQGGAVVFAVSKYESSVTAEPVVIYRNGAYVPPPVHCRITSGPTAPAKAALYGDACV